MATRSPPTAVMMAAILASIPGSVCHQLFPFSSSLMLALQRQESPGQLGGNLTRGIEYAAVRRGTLRFLGRLGGVIVPLSAGQVRLARGEVGGLRDRARDLRAIGSS